MAVAPRTARSAAASRRPRSIAKQTALRWPPQWPAEAWWSIGVTALFLGLTIWWVESDHSIPISDAGFHLKTAIEVFKDLQTGKLPRALEPHLQYPPVVYLVAAAGAYIGGLGIPSMVLAENFFFVPLLALGCYQIGRLAFGPRAGLLAVVFALGTPLLARLFHLMLLDAPQAAMAAVSVWLILETRYFASRRWCAAAGLALGLGMLTKESFALFVIGPLAVTFVRGGWRNWENLMVLGAVALVVAGPWYINDLSQVQEIGTGAANSGQIGKGPLAPPRFSADNLQWYLYSFLDTQVYLPLFLFSAVGGVWALVGFARRRWVSPYAPELAIGAFVAWFGLTQTFVHDNRYGMSMLVYLAVFGSFWIVRLPRNGRLAATTALVLIASANTLSSFFGTGGIVSFTLPGALQRAQDEPNIVTIYSNEGYLISAAPERHGNMLATLKALKRIGVVGVVSIPSEAPNQEPFNEGLDPLMMLAGLKFSNTQRDLKALSPTVAVFDREPLGRSKAPPCVTINDGTGVWIRLGNPFAPGAKDFCPSHKPQYYNH